MLINKLFHLKLFCQADPSQPPGGGAPAAPATPAAEPDLTKASTMDSILGGLAGGILDDLDAERSGQAPPPKQPEPEPETAGEQEQEPEMGTAPEGESEGTDSEQGPGDGEAPEWVPIKAKDDKGYPIDFEVKKAADGTPMYRFKAAGESIEASHTELIQGYQRQADYNRKVNEVLDKATSLDPYAGVVTQLQGDPNFVQYVVDYLNGTPQQLQREQIVTDEMIRQAVREDPDKAEELFALRDRQQAQMEAQRRTAAAREAYREQFIERQEQLAQRIIPNYDEVKSSIDSFLISVGFSEQEVKQSIDHRARNVANMARLYMENLDKQRAPTQELEDKRQPATPPKTIKSGPGKQLPKGQSRSDALLAKAQKTGKDSDWQAALTAMVPDSWVR